MENRKPRIRERIGLKVFAVIIAVILFGVCFFSAVLTMVCLKNGYYTDGGEQFFVNAVWNCGSARVKAEDFATRLVNAQPLRYENGVLQRKSINELMDGLRPDDCNFIFLLKNGNDVQLYTTADSESAHVFGYQCISDGSSSRVRVETMNLDAPEEYTESFSDIGYANSEMFRLASANGFTGTLYAVLDQSYNGAITENYVELAQIGENGAVVYYKDYSDYADTDAASEVISGEAEIMFVPDITTVIPQSGGFDRKAVIDSFDVIDPEDGNIYALEIDANGYGYYRGEHVARQYLQNFLNYMDFENRSRLIRYLGAQTVSVSFTLQGTIYPIETELYHICVYVDKTPGFIDGAYFTIEVVNYITMFGQNYPTVCIASGVLLCIFGLFIIFSAGHRYGVDDIKPIWFDKIPFEIFAVANFFAAASLITDYKLLVYDDIITDMYSYRMLEIAIVFAYPFCVGLLMILTAMTLAVRLKAQSFWRTTAVGMVVLLIVKVFRFIGFVLRSIRLTWKVILLSAALFFLDIFTFAALDTSYDFIGIFIWFIGHVMLTLLLLLWAVGFTRIRDYSKKIADGELGAKINHEYLFGDLKRTANDLEGVGEGVRKAVDERMRSERLKTELITNVSHDLKTPLTSIVNYVDILSKDDIQDESAREHIDVLKRQAARMKKLIEDLVEVSKASSGNVSVNLERTDVNLLLTQTVTEYSQKFDDCRLTPVVKIPERKMIANLDGRLMWRVLDNLCNNICKYALAGTRVYITAEDRDDAIDVSFKNISRFPLDVSGDDLMERFVRGDSSRNTEGSGLGLSIAKSLCDLQGVGFSLAIDGDLFKAEITIQKATDDELLSDEPIVYSEPIEIREHVVAPDMDYPEELIESAEDLQETVDNLKETVDYLEETVEPEQKTTESVIDPASEDIDETIQTQPEDPAAGEKSQEE